MTHKNVILPFIFILLTMFSCSIQKSAKENSPASENHPGKNIRAERGLLINNGINRGTGYTDSLGSKYNLRYIPVIITNDSTIPIRLQLSFSKEYEYSINQFEEIFQVIPLPREWALDGTGVTEKMNEELSNYIEKPELSQTINPGEDWILGIGTLYPNPPKFSGVLPKVLFTADQTKDFPTCDWEMRKDSLSKDQITLWLRLNFGEYCQVIPCGYISFPDK